MPPTYTPDARTGPGLPGPGPGPGAVRAPGPAERPPAPASPAARTPQGRTGWTPARTEAFLAALRQGDTVADAAGRAGVSKETVYKRRRRDRAFADLMVEAQGVGLRARARLRERRRAPFRAMSYRLVRRTGTAGGAAGRDRPVP
ncbi:hypothetical protein ACIRD2_17970 [Streptomyces sp. NPDC093595]|uniref:hypothetical protein n=1 Tax=Streptomyces sp. NPDC093595 TaxID=3366045 RepID=UPI0037FD49F7